MLKHTESTLLCAEDPAPVIGGLSTGSSHLLLSCDHAGNRFPARLGDMGVAADDLEDHIAIDIGIYPTTAWMAHYLDAPIIAQAYSRLVIDCNRKPGTPGSMPLVSDGRNIPANRSLSDAERNMREREIFKPYQDAVGELIEERRRCLGRAPILCAMHSFTRIYGGARRNCDIGIIHEGPSPIGDVLFEALHDASGLNVGRNVPYEIDPVNDQTIPAHCCGKDVPYIEIEICQDHLTTCNQQRRMAKLMSTAFAKVNQLYAKDVLFSHDAK